MRATNCKIVRREIDESDVGQDLSSVAREHVRSCEHCRDFYEGRRELRLMLGSLETVAAPSDFDFRVRARLANDATRSNGSFFGNRSFGIPAATVAALLLLLGGGLAFRSLTRSDNPTTAVRSESAAINQGNIAKPKQEGVAITVTAVPTNGHEGTVKSDNGTQDTVRKIQPRVQLFRPTVASQRTGSRLATQDLSTLPAPVVKQENAVASAETSPVFAIETPSEPLKFSLDYDSGISRTISLPKLSFGSERTLTGNGSLVKTSTKRVW